MEWLGRGRVVGGAGEGEVRGGRQGQVERWSGMVGKGKGEEVAVRAGRVFTDAAPLLLGSADIYMRLFTRRHFVVCKASLIAKGVVASLDV